MSPLLVGHTCHLIVTYCVCCGPSSGICSPLTWNLWVLIASSFPGAVRCYCLIHFLHFDSKTRKQPFLPKARPHFRTDTPSWQVEVGSAAGASVVFPGLSSGQRPLCLECSPGLGRRLSLVGHLLALHGVKPWV